MPSLHLYDLPLYALPPAMLLVVAILLHRRGWASEYRAFVALLLLHVLEAAILIPAALRYTQTRSFGLYRVYFYTYWSA